MSNFWLPSTVYSFLYPPACFIYFNSSGFRQISSGGMISSPSFSIAFLLNDFKAFFMGVEPWSLGLVVLLMWFTIRNTCSWFNPSNELPFGSTYLMYSWFFLIIIGQKGMKNNLKMVRNRAKQKLVVQFFFWSVAVEVTNAINFFSKNENFFVRFEE